MTVFSSATKESAKMTKDFAANDIKSAANSVERSAERAERKAHNVVDNFADYANDAGRKVRKFFDEAGNELHVTSDRVKSEIRTNPIRSSLIALGVGVLLGAIARR